MGACSFSTIARGKTPEEAYRTACEAAVYERGHDPYNGTISTTNGFTTLRPPAGLPVRDFIRELREDAQELDNRPDDEVWDEERSDWVPNSAADKPLDLKHPALRNKNPFSFDFDKRDCVCFDLGPDGDQNRYLFAGVAAE